MLIDEHAHALSEEIVRRIVDTPGFGWALEATGRGSYRYAGGNPSSLKR